MLLLLITTSIISLTISLLLLVRTSKLIEAVEVLQDSLYEVKDDPAYAERLAIMDLNKRLAFIQGTKFSQIQTSDNREQESP